MNYLKKSVKRLEKMNYLNELFKKIRKKEKKTL